MPQQSGQHPTQTVGNAGPLTLSALGVQVSFSPALCRLVTPQFAPVQWMNVTGSGALYVFPLATTEELVWHVDFVDLPWFDDPQRQTEGLKTLRNFVRQTLNYSAQVVMVTHPDGMIEEMRYLRGIETFHEASGASGRAQRWTGTILFRRRQHT